MTSLRRLDLRAALLLLAADALLLAVGVSYGLAQARDPAAPWPELWQFDHDWGLAEMLNYGKWLLAAGVLLAGWRRGRAPVLLAAAFVMALACADDALQLHERGGVALALATGLHERLGGLAFQLGEIAVWAALGLACLLPLVMGWRRADAALRRRLRPLGALFLGVALFAMGVDTLHTLAGLALPGRPLVGGAFMVIEGAGENMLLSLLAAYALGAFRPAALPDPVPAR
ncbi:hypothetical protein [Limimaricola pyoseonensis]|uniref:Uncharacterized protein n=1 Tax=Limimaricola pyoseonensis TaxID=521013 RepID=A0A1G7FU16_9RHOB|nr:hypothetical protein [Limimaricola pyoseonensis]SDE79413.1 hypothetical protein SAMN04488567_2573 [Limimaricola pyoseonensis]